jgi:two-component system chemotaxis response regulator CheB
METKRLIEATCPDCRGPLSETKEDSGPLEYRCLVGHVYSPRSLLEAHSDTQEKALWSAVVALEEAAKLVRSVMSEFPPDAGSRLERQAELKEQQAQDVRRIIERLEPFHVD